ncbi:MAG: twin transmembrane helix small protein [Gammaproteobacteria bacterium]
MLTKVLIIAVFLTILGSLASGLLFLVKDKGQSDRTIKALTLRISLSVFLFLLLFLLFAAGLITPHGVQP